jgi:hypothetical protein
VRSSARSAWAACCGTTGGPPDHSRHEKPLLSSIAPCGPGRVARRGLGSSQSWAVLAANAPRPLRDIESGRRSWASGCLTTPCAGPGFWTGRLQESFIPE